MNVCGGSGVMPSVTSILGCTLLLLLLLLRSAVATDAHDVPGPDTLPTELTFCLGQVRSERKHNSASGSRIRNALPFQRARKAAIGDNT